MFSIYLFQPVKTNPDFTKGHEIILVKAFRLLDYRFIWPIIMMKKLCSQSSNVRQLLYVLKKTKSRFKIHITCDFFNVTRQRIICTQVKGNIFCVEISPFLKFSFRHAFVEIGSFDKYKNNTKVHSFKE